MDIESIINLDSNDLGFIGERLKEIRKELIEMDDIQDKRFSEFSLTKLSERLNMARSTLVNVERGSSMVNSIKIILYFYSLGYNPIWILLPDNEFVAKRNLGENLVYKKDIQEKYLDMEQQVTKALRDFKTSL
ncbi:MAG: helix-turn-helix transcriptional regulator [Bacteroidota bacterium]